MIHDHDDLSPELRSLFDAERRREGPPPGAQERVNAAILASIAGIGVIGASTAAAAAAKGGAAAAAAGSGAAATGTAATAATATVATAAATTTAATATGGIVAKGLAVALVAAMAGTAGTGVYLAARDEPRQSERPAVVAPADDDARPTRFDPAVLAPTNAPEEPAPAEPEPVKRAARPPRTPVERAPTVAVVAPEDPPPPPPVEATPEERAERLKAERALLDQARAAVKRGDGAGAIAALEAHEASYADGALVEERDALRVLALAKLGRIDDARAMAKAFRARYPSSLFLGALDGAVR